MPQAVQQELRLSPAHHFAISKGHARDTGYEKIARRYTSRVDDRMSRRDQDHWEMCRIIESAKVAREADP